MNLKASSIYSWADEFQRLYDKAVAQYAAGQRGAGTFFESRELKFLASIGCSAQELYDFAEDWCGGQDPSFATCLLITAVRRDYFLEVLHGCPASQRITMEDLPPKDAEVAGVKWLPRIIHKARAKLRGEMPIELMYGCGGDRAFLKQVDLHPADFLRAVWEAGNDDDRIIRLVTARLVFA